MKLRKCSFCHPFLMVLDREEKNRLAQLEDNLSGEQQRKQDLSGELLTWTAASPAIAAGAAAVGLPSSAAQGAVWA